MDGEKAKLKKKWKKKKWHFPIGVSRAGTGHRTVTGLDVLLPCVGLSVVLLVLCCRYLYSQTLTNRTFERVKVEVLNDASLVLVLREAFGDRASFDLWWDAHQISASTMFGIKLTTHRIFRAILGMGSVVVVAAGLVLRSSLADGGGE